MSMLGDLSDFALPDLLQMFERAGKTGQLSIWAPTGVHRLSFYQGRIVAAIPPDPHYALKQIILNSEAISDQVVQTLKKLSELSEPLGRYLKKQDLIDSSVLASAFRQQIHVGIYPLFALESGQFRFSVKTPIPYEEMTGMSKSSIEIAMDGLRRYEASQQLHDDLPLPDSRFVRASAELPLLKLSPLEWSILENISPDLRLSDLSQMLKADLLEVRQACCRLAKVLLIEEVLVKDHAAKISSPTSEEMVPAAAALKQHLQHVSVQPEEPILSAVTPAAEQTASVNSNLLSRFASMLKKLQ